MTAPWMQEARDGLYDVGIIADILKVLGGAEISGNAKLCGTNVDWLGDKLAEALNVVDAALNKAPRGAA